MTQPTATLTRQSAFVTLTMDEEVAQRVMALLMGALPWVNNIWARDLYIAIEGSGVNPPEELYDEVRHEIEDHIEGTADEPHFTITTTPQQGGMYVIEMEGVDEDDLDE